MGNTLFHSGQNRSGISHSGCGRTRGVNLAVLVCSNACTNIKFHFIVLLLASLKT